jgi:DNA repair exonuclease SbcCD nuclease subunit
MKNEPILCIGDIHLGVNKNNPLFFKIALDYADWINSVCQKHNIKTIIQLGDIFHNREMIHLPTINCAHNFFDKLREYNIHIVVGNHDSLLNNNSDVNSLKLLNEWPNITVHEKVSVIDDICFCGWGTKLEDIPKNNKIIFGHFDIKGFEMSSFKISEHGFSASDLMNRCQLLMSGHYHKPQVRFYDKKPLIYTGSAYQLNWGESGESKYVYILNTETLQYEPLENKISPRFQYIRKPEDYDKVQNNFVSIEVENVEDIPNAVAKLSALKALDIKTVQKPLDYKREISLENGDIVTFEERSSSVVECIEEYTSLLENITDEEKKIVTQKLNDLYSRCV